jgi:DNA-binding transcriptional LysR family regulator
MTQPAVSHALRRLREACGQELFVRHAHGVHPTPHALALWPQVRDALAALRHALAPGAFDPRRDAVQFRMAMADATAALLAPALVAGIEGSGALVDLRVLPLTTRDPRRLLEADEADLAVGFFPEAQTAIAARGHDSPLRHTRLYETRYVCVMRRGHPLAEGPLTLDAYCAAHHLLVSFSGRAHGYVDQALQALGRQRRVVLTVNQFFTAGRVVATTDLLTVLPRHFVGSTGREHELALCDLPLAVPAVHVEALWHRQAAHSSAHRWLRQTVGRAADKGFRVHRPTAPAAVS